MLAGSFRVTILLKLTKLLFVSCGLILAAAWLSISIYEIYWGYVFELYRSASRALDSLWQVFDIVKNPVWFWRCYTHQSFLRGVIHIAIFSMSIAIFWTMERKFRRNVSPFRTDLFKDIAEDFPNIRRLCSLGLILVSGVCLAGIVDCSGMVKHYGLRDLAYISDALGFYEIGERFYSFTRDSRGTTLASTCGMGGHDSDQNEVKCRRLNRMVEEVYGRNSLEMANRFAILANHLSSELEDFPAAISARQEAIAIFDLIGRNDRSANLLGMLAYDQINAGKHGDAAATIHHGLAVANSKDFSILQRDSALQCLYPAAYSVHGKAWADQHLPNIPINWNSVSCARESDGSEILLIFFVALMFRLKALILRLERRCLQKLALRWETQLSLASTSVAKAASLQKLINLEMFRGNPKVANDYSIELLKL